jgi:RNA polymerase sigma-70 factor (ECF subfamily)
MGSNEEADLLASCRRGDAQAWERLFDLHYSVTGRFLFQLASDLTPEDVDELCQEVFLAVIKNLQSFHGQSQFQTWVFRIAANKARDFRSKTHAVKRGGGQVALSLDVLQAEGHGAVPLGSAPAPDVLVAAAEDARKVRDALEELDLPCREIIELRYFADLQYEEISRSLALNVKTVSSRLSKCLDRLEAILSSGMPRDVFRDLPSNSLNG